MNPTERSEALYDACVDKDWDAAIALCSREAKSEGTEAPFKGKHGRTCLQEAVEKSSPCRVVRAILDAHNECVVRITRLTDEYKITALHIAADRSCCSHDEASVLHMLVESDPHCATMSDWEGYTPLHCLVNNYPRKEDKKSAIKIACARALLNASTTESILSHDVCQCTALHTACTYSDVLPGIVQMILQRCPQAALSRDSNGETPLHYTANNDDSDDNDDFNCAKMTLLLKALTILGESGAAAVDNHGKTPLHYAVCSGYDNPIILLIRSQPESVCIKDKDGMTPLDHVQEAHAETMNCETAGRPRHEYKFSFWHVWELSNMLVKTMLSVRHGHKKLTEEESLWMTTEQERSGNAFWLDEQAMIHNYLRLGSICPLYFVFNLVRSYPHQAQMKDARGALPLHIALENGVQHAKRIYPLGRYNNGFGNDCRFLIKGLIEAYPQAAKMTNCNGDLPLHIMLQSGVGTNGWHCSLKHLLRAHPAALLYEEIDLLPVLLPLILSRVGEGNDLSALYEFLREMPLLYL